MKRSDLLKKLEDIFRDIFDDSKIVLFEDTKPEDIENWDSIGHVYLTVELEDEFGIEFDERMQRIETVGDVIDLLLEKMN